MILYKRKLFLVLPFCLLIVVSALIYWLTTDKIEYSEGMFAIYDSHLIDKIDISDNSSAKVVLFSDNRKWFVGKNNIANQSKVSVIINMLPLLQIDAPVAKELNDMINNGVVKPFKKATFYSSKTEKTFTFYSYQGFVAVVLNNQNKAYYVNIPGYSLEFSSVLSLTENMWKSNILYLFDPVSITGIKVDYLDDKYESLEVNRLDNSYSVVSLKTGAKINSSESEKLFSYISFASSLEFDDFLSDKQLETYNSIVNNPDVQIDITTNNESHILKVYYVADSSSTTGFDLNKVFVVFDKNEPVTISFLKIDNLLKEFSYFN